MPVVTRYSFKYFLFICVCEKACVCVCVCMYMCVCVCRESLFCLVLVSPARVMIHVNTVATAPRLRINAECLLGCCFFLLWIITPTSSSFFFSVFVVVVVVENCHTAVNSL